MSTQIIKKTYREEMLNTLATLILLLSCATFAFAGIETTLPKLKQEKNVDDVPFNTREVVMDYYFDCAVKQVSVIPEPESNDFPFNTACIKQHYSENNQDKHLSLSPDCLIQTSATKSTLKKNTMAKSGPEIGSISLPEETEVNDIPFDTAKVVESIVESNTHPAKVNSNFWGLLFPCIQVGHVVRAGIVSLFIVMGIGVLAYVFFSFV